MSESFNGYHVWLGIPPNEQPPNHYRLLGIAIFETDLDVIDHAADRQMAHVRTFQAGRHAALSQQILNELASARVCLLNAERKQEYDTQLRAKLTAAPQVAAVPAAALPVGKAIPVTPVAQPVLPTATPLPERAAGATEPKRPQSKPARPVPVGNRPSDRTSTGRGPTGNRQAASGESGELDNSDVAGSDLADSDQQDSDLFGLAAQAASGRKLVDNYDQELSSVAAGVPRLNPLAARRHAKSDLAFQRIVTALLLGVAVIIVSMLGYQLVSRYSATIRGAFELTPAAEGPAVNADELAVPDKPAAPAAPAPAPPGLQP